MKLWGIFISRRTQCSWPRLLYLVQRNCLKGIRYVQYQEYMYIIRPFPRVEVRCEAKLGLCSRLLDLHVLGTCV